jgi:hypothetical protein
MILKSRFWIFSILSTGAFINLSGNFKSCTSYRHIDHLKNLVPVRSLYQIDSEVLAAKSVQDFFPFFLSIFDLTSTLK